MEMNNKRISVICATPPRPNPGMASVDLGFYSFARRYGLTEHINYYQLILTSEHHVDRSEEVRNEISTREKLPFTYKCMRGALKEIYDSDVIIFWGDFSHMRRQVYIIAKRLVALGITTDIEKGVSLVYTHYFLTEAPEEVLHKVVVFGETILFNNLTSYNDEVYVRNFIRLFSNARCSYLRDVYSAFNLAHLLKDYSGNFLGMDCSLLFRNSDLEQMPNGTKSRKSSGNRAGVGVFFGRSECDLKLLGKFSKELCDEMSEKAEWISWWYSTASNKTKKKVRAGFRKLDAVDNNNPTLEELYRDILSYRFIITDTYHLCLNAWKLGIPAVCIGQGYSRTGVVNCGEIMAQRDKRNVFYSMYEAMNFYVYAEEIEKPSSRQARIKDLSSVLSGEYYKEAVCRRINTHSEYVESKLSECLTNMLC